MKNILYIIIGVCFIPLTACTDKLGETEAIEIITTSFKFPKENVDRLYLNYPKNYNDEETLELLDNFEKGGLLIKKKFIDSLKNEVLKIELTQLGKTFISKDLTLLDDTSTIYIITGYEQFEKITSIETKEDEKHPMVNFSTKLVTLTPFGKLTYGLKEGMIIDNQLDFVKENGEWHITYVR